MPAMSNFYIPGFYLCKNFTEMGRNFMYFCKALIINHLIFSAKLYGKREGVNMIISLFLIVQLLKLKLWLLQLILQPC